MKKNIQSIGYVAFLLTSIGALLKAVLSYKNPFSLYENPLVWILIVMLVLVIIVKEYFDVNIQNLLEKKGSVKNTIQSLKDVAFSFLSIGVLLKAVSSYKNPFSLNENPLIWILIVMIILVVFVKEYFSLNIQNLLEKQELARQGLEPVKVDYWQWYKTLNKKLTNSKAIEEESEIVIDHNYDGIRELDNVLPPWWVYLFYASIAFAVVYLIRFQFMDGNTPENEYKNELAIAKAELDKYKINTPKTFDVSKLIVLTDQTSLSTGKSIFKSMCSSCHANDGGGGIGPNLTDEHWILGGGIKNVFNTIHDGGRDGKGMISWGKNIKPKNIQKIASYILSLQGTTPAKPKKPEGEIWVD